MKTTIFTLLLSLTPLVPMPLAHADTVVQANNICFVGKDMNSNFNDCQLIQRELGVLTNTNVAFIVSCIPEGNCLTNPDGTRVGALMTVKVLVTSH